MFFFFLTTFILWVTSLSEDPLVMTNSQMTFFFSHTPPMIKTDKFLFCLAGYISHSSSSVQFSHSVVSDSLWPHGLQHTRPPCPSPTPRVYPNSCPLSQWCHPAISSSVVPFSSCPQSLPASGSFPMPKVAKVLEFQLQHQSFQWTPRTDNSSSLRVFNPLGFSSLMNLL